MHPLWSCCYTQAISEHFREKELIYKALYKFSCLLYFAYTILAPCLSSGIFSWCLAVDYRNGHQPLSMYFGRGFFLEGTKGWDRQKDPICLSFWLIVHLYVCVCGCLSVYYLRTKRSESPALIRRLRMSHVIYRSHIIVSVFNTQMSAEKLSEYTWRQRHLQHTNVCCSLGDSTVCGILYCIASYRRCFGEESSDRVSGDDTEQGAGAAQVQESSALECQECCAVWSNQPHHPHGQRPQPAGPRL